MNDKQKGTLLIILGITITLASIFIKLYQDVININQGSSYMWYTFIWFTAAFITGIGFLIRRSDELKNILKESQLKHNDELKDIKKKEREKDGFQKFLKDFNKQEIQIIELLHTFEGISIIQLQKEVTISKDKLNRILKNLEKKDVLTVMDNDKIYLTKLSK